jgi:hypothetical protein
MKNIVLYPSRAKIAFIAFFGFLLVGLGIESIFYGICPSSLELGVFLFGGFFVFCFQTPPAARSTPIEPSGDA